jgi:hypothetical protein
MKTYLVSNNFLLNTLIDKLNTLTGWEIQAETKLVLSAPDETANQILRTLLESANLEYRELPQLEPQPAPQVVEPAVYALSETVHLLRDQPLVVVNSEPVYLASLVPVQPAVVMDTPKNGKVKAAKEKTPRVAKDQQVSVQRIETCPYCQQPYHQSRKNQPCCTKDECHKAHAAKYARDNYARQHKNGKAAQPAAPAPIQPEISHSQEPAEIPCEPDPVCSNPQPTSDEPRENLPQRPWFVEDGPRAGQSFSNKGLRALLQAGNLRTGQHVRHQVSGRHEVAKAGEGKAQKLVRLFGENAPCDVLASELAN